MRISDWSSDVCSSDLRYRGAEPISSAWKSPPLWRRPDHRAYPHPMIARAAGRWLLAYPTSSDAEQGYFRRKRIQTAPQPLAQWRWCRCHDDQAPARIHLLPPRSEEQTSELQSLMRISYAVFCLKKKKK